MRRKEEAAGLEVRYHAVVHSNPAAVVVAVAAAAVAAAAESEIVEDRQSRTGLSRAPSLRNERNGRKRANGRAKETAAAAEFWVGLLDWAWATGLPVRLPKRVTAATYSGSFSCGQLR